MDTLYTFWDHITQYKTESVYNFGAYKFSNQVGFTVQAFGLGPRSSLPSYPKGPCTHIVCTLALKCSLYRYIGPKVYAMWVHGPLGSGCRALDLGSKVQSLEFSRAKLRALKDNTKFTSIL